MGHCHDMGEYILLEPHFKEPITKEGGKR